MTQEDYEPKLSWLSLSDDNKMIMLNGGEKYSGRLPLDIFRKNKSSDEQTRIVESVIYNICGQHGVDSISSETSGTAQGRLSICSMKDGGLGNMNLK
jgi:hypothetical protein